MIIEESNLRFSFQDENWWVVKFDEDINYTKVIKNLQGTKGVDFVGIYNSDNLFFFEVKNFRNHTMDIQSQERLANGGEDLTTEIAQKVRDSLACIIGASRNATNNIEKWRSTCNLISTNKPFKIIAWIEEDIPNTPYKIKSRKPIYQLELVN